MPAPTVSVTCTASDQSGYPVSGALYTARLNSTEIYQGFVVPEIVRAEADALGVCVLELWPNALGVAGSLYNVTAVNPDTGMTFLRTTAYVPNSPCNLHEILLEEPYPPLSAAAQALVGAQAALAQAIAQAVLADDDRVAAEIAAAQALTRSAAAALSQLNAGLTEIEVEADRAEVAAVATAFGNAQGAVDAATAQAGLAATAKTAAEAARDVSLVNTANLAASNGSALVGHLSPGTGAVIRTSQAKLREEVSVEDYGAVGGGTVDDTAAFSAALAANIKLHLKPNQIYKITQPLTITQHKTTLFGNGARLVYNKVQTSTASYAESCISVTGADNVTIQNLIFEYIGIFDLGDYGGFISAIHVEDADNFTASRVEAFGFSRAGTSIAILAGGSAYCKHPRILDCFLHHNRVAGILFGNTDGGIVRGNALTFNGVASSIGTGYGFAGWSANLPLNTLIEGNQASDNYRKGIDFHSGQDGVITDNICARNRIYGIYVMGGKGSWTISANSVSDMNWGNEFPTVAPYGIRVGNLVGQGTAEIPTSFVVNGNVISRMSKTAGQIFPLGESLVGTSYGKLTISNNIVDVGAVSQIINSAGAVTIGVAGNYHDIMIVGNQFTAASCDAVASPISISSTLNRQKVFSGNIVNIAAVTSTVGVFNYGVTSIASRSLIAVGNTIVAPISAWSTVNDPINVKRVVNELSARNVVNSVRWRDWDGYKFIDCASAIPTTGYWALGSTVASTSPTSSQGWVCTVAGTPGTWQPVGVIGAVKVAAQTDTAAADLAALKIDFNALLAKLRTAGLLTP